MSVNIIAQSNVKEEYIRKYYKLAIVNMQEHGIPASITMAQGMLESGNGTSYLATVANNHFAIKCHDWTGASVRKDDDKKNECFRKYDHPIQSFEDHSEFIQRERYQFLYDYNQKDYRAWAKGLKKAGYATDPKYPEKLITIIEENELYLLDEYVLAKKPNNNLLPRAIRENNDIAIMPDIIKDAGQIAEETYTEEKANKYNSSKPSANTQISAEGLSYIIVQNEKTYAEIAQKHNIQVWELYRYNDLHKKNTQNPTPGTRVYLEFKRSKYKKLDTHTATTGQTMLEIANLYGIRLKSLYKINKRRKDFQPQNGEVIYLNPKAFRKALN